MKEERKYELVKFIDDGFELEVNVSPKEETIWLTLDQMGELFERDKSVISRHIKKIYDEQELNENSTVAKNATVQVEGKRNSKNSFFIIFITLTLYFAKVNVYI